jgi:WD40 repeat protein
MKPGHSNKNLRRLECTLALAVVLSVFCRATPSRADEASTIISYGPVAFYQLNETNNPAVYPVTAVDSIGARNGVYLTNALNGYNGITGPQAAGFPANSGALKTTYNSSRAFVGLPGLPVATNTVTILAWINPNATSAQNQGAGLIFNTRDAGGGSGTNTCGFGFAQSGTARNGIYPLYAMWHNTGWTWNNSGLYPPTNQWSMVAAVFSPTNITVYLMSTNGIQLVVTNISCPVCSWALGGTNYLGTDPYSMPGRNFDGRIADLAIFAYCLKSNQLSSIFYAAGPVLASPPSPATVYQGSNATFTVAASGSPPLAYQWQRGGTNLINQGNVSGSTNSTLTLSNVQKADATNYVVVVTNMYGAVTSSIVSLTVLSTNFIQISSQPVSVTVSPDQTAQFTVTATTSGPLYYQWFAGLPGGAYSPLTDGGHISGSTTATLTISNEVVSDWGNYYVQISNADGVVVASSVVTLSLTSWEQFGQGGVVNAVATSPDSNWIASGSDDDTVKLWNAGSGSFAGTLAANGLFPVTALAFSHDSTTLAAGYTDGSIRLWNPANGALIRTINLYWGGKTNNLGKIASLSFSPDGQYLAAGSGDLYTRIWKVSDGTMNQAWVKNAGPVGSVAYSPDGTMLATGSEDKTVQVLNTSGWGNASGAPMTLGSNVTAVAFSPDGTTLVAGCLDRTITFWQTSSFFFPIRTLTNTTESGIASLAFGTDGQSLFSGDVSGYVTRWAASGWTATATWPAHTNGVGGVRSLAINTDNSKLVSGGADYRVSLWQASNGAALSNLTSHAGMITRACFSPDGSMVASAGNDGSVRLWAAGSGAPTAVLAIHTNQVGALAFSPDSTLLVSGGGCLDNTLRVFSCSNLALLQTIVATVNGVTALAISPDSSMVASAGDASEQVIRLWSLKDGSLVRTLAGHTNGTGMLAFSPNGQYLASGGRLNDGTIKLWNVNNGSLVHTFTPPAITDQYLTFALSGYTASGPFVTNTVVHTCSIQSLALNNNGTLLASAGASDGVINLWQTGTGTLLGSLTNLSRGARSVAFSPDGNYLAAAGSDAIQMWRTSDWQPVWNYTIETAGISSLSFSPNGTFLVFGRDDGTVGRIWNPLASPINLVLSAAQPGRFNIANPYSPFLSVWTSSNLADPSSWGLLTNVVAATNLVQVTDPSPSLPPVRFYRVTTPP